MLAQLIDQDVVCQLPTGLQSWMSLERYHLHRPHIFMDAARDPRFDTAYFPQNARPFLLPCYWVPRQHLYVVARTARFDALPGSGFASDVRDEVLFPIHPTALDGYREFLSRSDARDALEEGVRLWALPTSSIRTLLVWPDGLPERACFVKTSLLSQIVGERRVSRMRAARAIGLASVLAVASSELPVNFHFMSETLGFSPRRELDAGAVVRAIPNEVLRGEAGVAPLFSVIGGRGEHVPLLLRWLQQTALEPLQFVDETLCTGFAPLWVELALRRGLILEAHGQDLLLGVSAADGMPSGHWYYRDFEGLQVDWELRRACGHPAPNDLPHAWAWRETYETWGYRYCAFVWYKWRTSLHHYLHYVLNEVEASLRDWRQQGLIGGRGIPPGELTLRFSRHLFAAVERYYNVRMPPPYNIHVSLNRFLASLVELRSAQLRLRPG